MAIQLRRMYFGLAWHMSVTRASALRHPPTLPLAAASSAALAAAPPATQKQMLGEKLLPLVGRLQPESAWAIFETAFPVRAATSPAASPEIVARRAACSLLRL